MIAALLLALLPLQAQARSQPPTQHPRHNGVITTPRLLFMPPVERFYPAEARARGEQGVTRLFCQLQITGLLTDCVLRESSGFAALDEAAFRIAVQARYQPMLVDGTAVIEPVILPVRWILADG